MSLNKLHVRIFFLMGMACATAVLVVMTGTALWRHRLGEGFLFLIASATLAFIFFRRRILVLLTAVLSIICALAGLGTISRPSAPGILLTLGCAAGIYMIVVWDVRRNPKDSLNDWKTLFDDNPK